MIGTNYLLWEAWIARRDEPQDDDYENDLEKRDVNDQRNNCPWILQRGADGNCTVVLLPERERVHKRYTKEACPRWKALCHMSRDIAFWAILIQYISNVAFLPAIIERTPGVWWHFKDLDYADKFHWYVSCAWSKDTILDC